MAKGFALHIGFPFGNSPSGDTEAVDDATAMRNLTQARGFTTTLLTGAAATRSAVVDKIGEIAGQMKAGDLFVLTFSGHGIQQSSGAADQEGGLLNQSWILVGNLLLIDHQINRLLRKFPEGARIVVVSDSCNSGTVVLGPTHSESSARKARSEGSFFRFISPEEVAALLCDQAEDLEALAAAPVSLSVGPLKAHVLLLAACSDSQAAEVVNGHGVFTSALLKAMAQGPASYSDLFARIQADKNTSNPSQTPQFLKLAPRDPASEGRAPFMP